MALVIRMRQQGAKGRKVFRVVVTESKNPRDGKYLEMLGWYNPFTSDEKNCFLDVERMQHWLSHGAKISERAKSLVQRFAPGEMKEWGQKKGKKKTQK